MTIEYLHQISEGGIITLLFKIHLPLDTFSTNRHPSEITYNASVSETVAKPKRISCRFRINDKISAIKIFLESLEYCPENYTLRISFPPIVISDAMQGLTFEQAGVNANMIFDVIPIIK